MRVLVSLEGRRPGQTRRAIATIPYDRVHVLAADPSSQEVEEVQRLVEMTGATFRCQPVVDDDLLGAFSTITDTLASYDQEEQRAVQVNAGKDANLLSAAGLLACLHAGVEAHFVHEKGHDLVPVLTSAPLSQLLTDGERAALETYPDEGYHVSEVSEHDPKALNGLRDRGLIALEGDRLELTAAGRAFRAHVERMGGA